MQPLDDRTAEKIADIVVDRGGPYERKSYELAPLLGRAGWSPVPEYDGSPRVHWLAEQLIENRADPARIERFLCRVCDPREYDDGKAAAEAFRGEVNRILEAEGLVISAVGGRPVLGELGADGAAHYSEPDGLEERLQRLVLDKVAAEMLVNRLTDARLCMRIGAHTMAVIGLGSLVEGVLYAVLTERDEKVQKDGFINAHGKKVPADRVGLAVLLDTARENGWIQFDAHRFLGPVKEFRNFIHPRQEVVSQARLDHDTVMMCWGPIGALFNDVEERLATAGG
ncbi:hypothetical protein [Saccharopolyspora spinosa]|uniref:Uncharacterized protein n=1 Tax=Saccharopolyspora spinosa TaxID=60894 RepID=A0A2N3Y3X4_SACSN|nr:hypothetical protein [Saccharopolyspora spinosa]PKW17612.1 hypothetical protein A8926_5596 [Saccharopolyspora spinosa]